MTASTKVCKLCCSEFPATTEFFYAHGQTRDRLTPECKTCKKRRDENRRRAQGALPRWHEPGERVACTQCGTVHPWNAEFFITNKGKVQQPCKACNRKRASDWQDANPDRARERRRLHARTENAKNKSRMWRRNNPGKVHDYYMKRREAHQEAGRRWVEAHPERVREIKRASSARHPETSQRANHKRLARKKGLPDTLTRRQWLAAQKFFGHRCAYCGQIRKPTYEHVIPYSSPDCPGNIASNVVPACFPCNLKKSDTPLDVWLVKRFGETQAQEILQKVTRYQSQC